MSFVWMSYWGGGGLKGVFCVHVLLGWGRVEGCLLCGYPIGLGVEVEGCPLSVLVR